MPTIGVDFKVITKLSPSGNQVKYQLWDTAGNKFKTQVQPFYKVGQYIVFIYDVSRP